MENAIVKLRRSRAKQLWLPMFEDLIKVYRRRIRLVDGKWKRGAERPGVHGVAGRGMRGRGPGPARVPVPGIPEKPARPASARPEGA